jgi:NAD(P)-dependent dehydrogenase (short-subunit alcohol dehydrogenase family)
MAGEGTGLVWGAAGGIGRALVERLSADGWTVGAVSRTAVAWPQTLQVGGSFEADVADDFSVQRAAYAAAQELPPVDLLIYAAGDIVSAQVSVMEDTTWRRILDANLSGAFRVVRHSLPLLADSAYIVLIGAYSERLALPGLSAYAAAKAGLATFAAALAKEERKRRILLVRPGAVATPLWDKASLRLPRDAASPGAVAAKILQACRDGQTGVLDL